jgi:hypothetical protein
VLAPLFPREFVGQLCEGCDGDAFGRVVLAEFQGGYGWGPRRMVLTLRVAGPAAGGKERTLTYSVCEFVKLGWKLLGFPHEIDVPVVGAQSCIRCHRINFGPCISATCQDLQAYASAQA